jgi:hypothetical protein
LVENKSGLTRALSAETPFWIKASTTPAIELPENFWYLNA